jgi:arylsulfatase A-like enzyme
MESPEHPGVRKDPRLIDWESYNVLLITLDACRFDSLALAKTPRLDQIGVLRKAITHGTFTLPAHMAFFSGYLPNVVEHPLVDFLSRERFQLWRLTRAKEKGRDTYGLLLKGDTIVEGFRNRGFYTLGVGGVRWFLTKTLTGLFDEFLFWGPRDYSDWFAIRRPEDIALNHLEEIMERITAKKRWFLFINSLETHAPYNDGLNPVDDEVQRIIRKAAPIWAGRKLQALDTHVLPEEFKTLHKAQIKALEAVDQRIGRLIDELPKPFIVVVCGDHGECFGENGQWGHGFVAQPVLEVPLIVGFVHER